MQIYFLKGASGFHCSILVLILKNGSFSNIGVHEIEMVPWNYSMMIVVITAMSAVIKTLIFTFLFLATRWLPPGAALPVYWLASLQGHTSLQALHPAVGQEIG